MCSNVGFCNLPDQILSGHGHIVFLVDERRQGAPLGWTSDRVKRVVGSTVTAEDLSLQMALSHGIFLIVAYIDLNNIVPGCVFD